MKKLTKIAAAAAALCLGAALALANEMDVLALGAGITGPNLAKRMVEIFLSTEFEGGRHQRRIALVDGIQP